jgi:hypothetical protein
LVRPTILITYDDRRDFTVSNEFLRRSFFLQTRFNVLVLLPRLVRYQEHFDDHQFQIAEVVKRIPRILVSEDSPDDFRQKVMSFLHEPPVVASALGGDEPPQ